MFAPVWQQVVRGAYRSAPAWLDGYRRYALANEPYPGMVQEAGGRVDGLLYCDVSEDDLARLDAFEGDQYLRLSVPLSMAAESGTLLLQADTYVFTAVEQLSQAAWDPQAFALARFIASYCRDKAGG